MTTPTLLQAINTVQNNISIDVNKNKIIFIDVSDCKIGINCIDTNYSLEVAKSNIDSNTYEGFISTYGLIVNSSSQYNFINYINISNCDICNIIIDTANITDLSVTSLDVSNQLNVYNEANIYHLDASHVSIIDASINDLSVATINVLGNATISAGTITTLDTSFIKSNNIIMNGGGYIYYNSPELPVTYNETILTTKGYVDGLVQGIHVKASVEYATRDGEDLSYISSTELKYNITNTHLLDDISNISLFSQYDRILVKNQTDATENGLYKITDICNTTSLIVLSRTSDLSYGSTAQGVYVFVDGSNSSQENTSWIQSSDISKVIVGDQSLNFVQFSRAGEYKAGANITIQDLTISVKPDLLGIHYIDTTLINAETIDVSNLTISESLTVNSANHGYIKVYDISVTNLEILNSLIVNDGCHGTFFAQDASIGTLEILNSLIVNDGCHGTFFAQDASIGTLEILNSLIVNDGCHGTFFAQDASIGTLEILNSLIVNDGCHGTFFAQDASIGTLEILNSLIVNDGCHGTFFAQDASIGTLENIK